MSCQVTLIFHPMRPVTFILQISTAQSQHHQRQPVGVVYATISEGLHHPGQSCPHGGRQPRACILPTVGLGFPGVVGWRGGPQSPQMWGYVCQPGYGQRREKLVKITTAE